MLGPGHCQNQNDFKIWPIILQGSGPSRPFLVVKKSRFDKKYSSYLRVYELKDTESTFR